jgi:hypothetical protein
MKRSLNMLVVLLFVAAIVLIVAVGLARHDRDLLAPLDLFLILAVMAVYLLPAGLALYRECKAGFWIAALDVFLGWTVLGWFAALGWAASGKTRPMPVLAANARRKIATSH